MTDNNNLTDILLTRFILNQSVNFTLKYFVLFKIDFTQMKLQESTKSGLTN